MPTFNLTCVDPDHASRSGEPDFESVVGVLTLASGSPSAQQLAAGGRCRACARLRTPARPIPVHRTLSVALANGATLALPTVSTLARVGLTCNVGSGTAEAADFIADPAVPSVTKVAGTTNTAGANNNNTLCLYYQDGILTARNRLGDDRVVIVSTLQA